MVRGTLTPAKKTQPINQYEYQSWKLCTELGESPIDASDPETLPPVRVHLDNFNTRRITEALHTDVLTKNFAHKNWPTNFASDGLVQATSVPRGKDETDENGHVVKLFNTYLVVSEGDAMARQDAAFWYSSDVKYLVKDKKFWIESLGKTPEEPSTKRKSGAAALDSGTDDQTQRPPRKLLPRYLQRQTFPEMRPRNLQSPYH